jgi:hypothetical protein
MADVLDAGVVRFRCPRLSSRSSAQNVRDVPWFLPVSQCEIATPSPYSVNKFLVFNGLLEGCGGKILLSLDLAAESSQ